MFGSVLLMRNESHFCFLERVASQLSSSSKCSQETVHSTAYHFSVESLRIITTDHLVFHQNRLALEPAY